MAIRCHQKLDLFCAPINVLRIVGSGDIFEIFLRVADSRLEVQPLHLSREPAIVKADHSARNDGCGAQCNASAKSSPSRCSVSASFDCLPILYGHIRQTEQVPNDAREIVAMAFVESAHDPLEFNNDSDRDEHCFGIAEKAQHGRALPLCFRIIRVVTIKPRQNVRYPERS